MKRVGRLFDQIASARNLIFASWRASAGKRERASVRSFSSDLESECRQLSHDLRNGSFRFGKYTAFQIQDPKTRTTHAPPFRDRVIHHAILAVAGPVFERGSISHSFACRAGRGQHRALGMLAKWIQPHDWFFKADLRRFYDSIDHERLRILLDRRFRESRLLQLFDRLLESYAHTPGKGLPIGALTSQYLGNFYLDPVDHFAMESLKAARYMRYMDDMLFLDDPGRLKSHRESLAFLLEGLGLEIKNHGILNRCELGVPYLGFVIYPDRTRLNRPGRARLRRRMKSSEREYALGKIDEAELQAKGSALFAHAQYSDDVAWRRTILKFSRYREVQEPQTRDAGRLVEQHREQVPLGLSQQELER